MTRIAARVAAQRTGLQSPALSVLQPPRQKKTLQLQPHVLIYVVHLPHLPLPVAEAHRNPAMHRDCFSASNSWRSSFQGENVGSTRQGQLTISTSLDPSGGFNMFHCILKNMSHWGSLSQTCLKTFDGKNI